MGLIKVNHHQDLQRVFLNVDIEVVFLIDIIVFEDDNDIVVAGIVDWDV